MKKTLSTFATEMGTNHALRAVYRSDPIKAMQYYGLTEISLGELTSEATMKVLFNLPDMLPEDLNAYVKILEYFAEHGS
jgi:hypothetical protein